MASPLSIAPDSEDARARVASAATLLSGLVDQVVSVSDEDLVALSRGVEAIGRRGDALRTRVAGEVDARSDRERSGRASDDRLGARYGCRNGVELLERTTRTSAQTLRRRIRLDRCTRERATPTGQDLPAVFPEVSTALRSGDLGVDAAQYLIDEFTRLERRGGVAPDEMTVAEREIVRSAVRGASGAAERDTVPDEDTLPETFDEFQVMVDTWLAFLNRDGIEPDAEYAERFRGISLGRLRDGLVPVHGNLVPEAAAGLQLLFDAHNGSPTRFAPTAEGAAETAHDDDPVHDPRTAPQKRHDVLVSVIQTAAASADAPSLGGGAPTLLVTLAAEDLDGGIAMIERTKTSAPTSLAHRVACTGAVQKLVFDRAGRIVRLGTPERLFNAHQRRAIVARDGGCVIPGCSIPAAWCEIHHVTEHSRGGPTHTDNGVLLCWHHHHTLDRSGWTIRMRGGAPEVRAPGWHDPTGTYHPIRNHRTERERVRRLTRRETSQRELAIPVD